MNAERLLIAAECIGDAVFLKRRRTTRGRKVFWPADRAEPGYPVPARKAYAQMRAAELMVREGSARFEAGRRPARKPTWRRCSRPSVLGGRRGVHSRRMAASAFAEEYDIERKCPRDAACTGGADQHELNSLLYRGACAGLPRSY